MTDRRTDTAWQHRPCLCIESRYKSGTCNIQPYLQRQTDRKSYVIYQPMCIEYLQNDKLTTCTSHDCHRPLIQSDMWPIELCHCQWLLSTHRVISTIFLWKSVRPTFPVASRKSRRSSEWHYRWPWVTFENHFRYYIVSQKNAPTLASSSFHKRGLILIIFGKQHQHTFKKWYACSTLLSLHFYLLYLLWNCCDGNDAFWRYSMLVKQSSSFSWKHRTLSRRICVRQTVRLPS